MAIYKTYENQSVYDICLNIYGSLNFLIKMMSDNNLNFIDKIQSGTSIVYDDKFKPSLPIIATSDNMYSLAAIQPFIPLYFIIHKLKNGYSATHSINFQTNYSNITYTLPPNTTYISTQIPITTTFSWSYNITNNDTTGSFTYSVFVTNDSLTYFNSGINSLSHGGSSIYNPSFPVNSGPQNIIELSLGLSPSI